jgi:hypothetical protein
MLSDKQLNVINQTLNETYIRRLLVRYFSERGFEESFDRRIFPPQMQDIPESIPEIGHQLEIVPFVEDIDPHSGYGRVGWNLFVMGNQRLYLGETEHANMNELARQMDDAQNGVIDVLEEGVSTSRAATPRRIVSFITRILSGSSNGFRTVIPDEATVVSGPSGKSAPLAGRGMFNHNRPARGEM